MRTVLTAAMGAVFRVADAVPFAVSGRADTSGAATATKGPLAKTDSAPRQRIRSAVFYQADRSVTSSKCHEKPMNRALCARKSSRARFYRRAGARLETARERGAAW